jgi:uncharacterized protein (UPF0332 family)
LKEIQGLLKRSQIYMKSAEILLREKDFESAVSRSYYAMFYCVEALLLTKNIVFSSHKGVISAFGEHFIKTGIFPKEMSREFIRAFEKRQISDYEYTLTIEENEAMEIYRQGIDFIEKVKKYILTISGV